jgi:hypothetical protein
MKPRRLGILLAAGLLVASGSLFGSMPARADGDAGGAGGGGTEARGDTSASSRDGIYEAQRGGAACGLGVICNVPEATPARLLPSPKRR